MPKPAYFTSRAKDQIMVLEPADYNFSASGRVIGETKGIKIQFVNGMHKEDDPVKAEKIRARLAQPDAPEGITEIDPQIFAPSSHDVLMELVVADEKRTLEILQAERKGFERPDVIEACENKLAVLK